MSLEQNSSTQKMIDLLSPLIEPLGYEIAHLELILSKQKLMRIFIDKLPSHLTGDPKVDRIGLEDCTKVSRALNEPLDTMEQVNAVFGGVPYELEVSSPGTDRPLRRERDFERFIGQEARIQTFRPLSAEELQNAEYHSKNPKQKNFLGVLQGVRTQTNQTLVVLIPSANDGTKPAKKGASAKKAKALKTPDHPILIPFELISKAQLEPNFQHFE